MLDENHSLAIEFPEHQSTIHQLKMANANFKSMADRYHKLDHAIRGLENQSLPISDTSFGQMKLERAHLKDKIFEIIGKTDK
ncbi:DUF465 domain-containing protein [Photobacterium swingsii]|uniref:DUF465 domain-containing protein n=1 Tax=Photobacterium swingsii TaxID=680026 RepID=A0A0J8XZD7_9GAMM|nr:DUF465 domain-containing protein [Photobacterium swingsii]KMV30779.1 hypothetical protein AB733_09180 [Photobacterium swingsii]PSW25908.1 DUF465 domain-containing protein [Photobacterium swingsii]